MSDEELMWSVKKSEKILDTPIFEVEKRSGDSIKYRTVTTLIIKDQDGKHGLREKQ